MGRIRVVMSAAAVALVIFVGGAFAQQGTSLKTGHFFAPKLIFATVSGNPQWALDLEYGQVRGNGWLWSIDAGAGIHFISADSDCDCPPCDYDLPCNCDCGENNISLGLMIGASYNMGFHRQLANNADIAYGGAAGYWLALGSDGKEDVNDEYVAAGLVGPFIRLRYRFIDIGYRGLIGVGYNDDSHKDRLKIINQFTLGCYFSTNRRRS